MVKDKILTPMVFVGTFFLSLFLTSEAYTGIVIGCGVPLETVWGQSFKRGMELGVEEINSTGGILGEKIELIFDDTQGKPELAVKNVNKFISKDRVNIVYTFGSPETLAALQISKERKTPHVTTQAKICRITTTGYSNVLRFIELDEIKYNSLLAYFKRTRTPKKIAIFTWDREFEKQLSEYIIGQIKIMKIDPAPLPHAKIGILDTFALVSALKKIQADAVVMVSPDLTGSEKFFNTMVEQKVDIPILTAGFVASGLGEADTVLFKMFRQYGGSFPSTYVETDFDRDANKRALKFYEKYRKKFERIPDSESARAYDSIYFVAQVIKNAGKNFEKFSEEARKPGWFEGVTGTIGVLENGDIVKKASIIQIWKGIERKLVFEEGPKPKPHTAE